MTLNRDNATRHLKAIKRSLSKKQDYKTRYNVKIRNLPPSGYAELTIDKFTSQKTWYLPRFAVINPKGKIRVLFDNAGRTNGKPLTDALLSGPDRLQSLFSAPIIFRRIPIAVKININEMFRTIEIRKEVDKDDSLRFLGKENKTNNEPRECRTKPLLFDATSSPYATVCVNNKNTPLDDHDNIDNNESTLIMLWNTSSDALKSTLNLHNTREDVFKNLRPPTKRDVASAVVSTLDSIGIANPVLVQGEKPIQQQWREGIGWNEPIPMLNVDRFSLWTQPVRAMACFSQVSDRSKSFIKKTKNVKFIKRISRNTKWKLTKANKENRRIARRGTSKFMYSDNGTNLFEANKEFKSELDKMVVKPEEKGILWKYIPPGAPHMGGSWERLVRSVKTALTATLCTRYPSEEILQTLLVEAEHMRYISLDRDDQECHTPNHLLIGRINGACRIGNFTDKELMGIPLWKTKQRLTDYFWKRWLIEYVPIITLKYYNQGKFVSPAEGYRAIIVDNFLPHGTWLKGEIIQAYPGLDGVIRLVDVLYKKGNILLKEDRNFNNNKDWAHSINVRSYN